MSEIAIVKGRDLPISKKQSIEIANFIRGKNINQAKNILQRVIEKKIIIPFKRFNRDLGHKRGRIAAGRYPIKSSKEIFGLLNSVEKNASNKGLDVDKIYLKSIIVNKANSPWHYGRHRRRRMKRTHINIIVEERKENDGKKFHKQKD